MPLVLPHPLVTSSRNSLQFFYRLEHPTCAGEKVEPALEVLQDNDENNVSEKTCNVASLESLPTGHELRLTS